MRLRSLRTRIIAWSFVPTAIILGTVAWVTFVAYQRVTEELVVQRNQELTRLSAGQLGTALTEYTDLLADEARQIGARRGELGDEPGILQQSRVRLALFDGGALVLDSQGRVVASVPERPDALGQDWSSRPYFRHMLRFVGPIFSDTVNDGPGRSSVIVVAVPITGDEGQSLGMLAGMFRLGPQAPSAFYGQLTKLRPGTTGSAYLVDGAGTVLYHTSPDRIGTNILQEKLGEEILEGGTGAMRTEDASGRAIVASYAPVPGTSWHLVVQESWAALISPSRGYERFLLLLLALGLIVPALVVAGGVGRITTPINELITAAQQVAGGDFSQTIDAQTGDELEELAEQFNRMASQLQELYTHLEQRVTDRTRELAALNAIALTVSGSLALDEILNDALDKTLEVIGIEGGGIYMLDGAGDTLSIAAYRGLGQELVAEIDGLELGEGFSGHVAQTGVPLVIPNVADDPRLTRMAVREEGLHSLAVVPLAARGRILGTLFATTRGYREFTGQDVELLTSIGRQIGVAIENARLFEAESRQRREANLLVDEARLVSSTLDLDEVLQRTAEYAADIFGVDCCCVFLYDPSTAALVPAARVGLGIDVTAAPSPLVFQPSQRMQHTVLDGLKPLAIDDVPSDPHLSPVDPLDLQSVLVVPIEVGGRRLGVLQLGTCRPKRRQFTAAEGELALAVANQAAMAIDQARLYEAVQRRADEFRLIAEVGRQITSTLDIDEVLAQVVDLIHKAFGHYHVGIGLIEGDEVHYRVGAGALQDGSFQFTPGRLRVGEEGFTGWVAGTGEPLLVPDVSQDRRYVWMQGSMTRSELTVPVKAKGRVIGVLDVQSERLNAFDENDLVVLQSLASQAAIAIENAQHYEQAQQLAALEERNRLARELHDSVTQSLFSMTLLAQATRTLLGRDPHMAISQVARLQELAQGALAEMRSLIFELRPAAVEEMGLVPSLQKHLEALKSRHGLEVNLHVEGESELTRELEQPLFRIVQEALNNVVKHAATDRAEVTLSIGEDDVVLEVEDRGAGFDPRVDTGAQKTMGLESMRERAELLRGTFAIDSCVGEGTRIKVVIPNHGGDVHHG